MNKQLEELEKSIEELELILEITKKYGTKRVPEMMMKKKLEDGLLKNLKNANIYQLKNLKINRLFQYYEQKEINKIIDCEILKKIRKEKLQKIL